MDLVMDCNAARLVLWPDPEGAHAGPGVREAFAHYRGCAQCQGFFRTQRALGDRLRGLRVPPAPPHLRDRTLAALDNDEAGRARRRARWMIASGGALVAAAAALILFVGRPADPMDVAVPLVRHMQATADEMESSDPAALAQWLSSRAGYAVSVPELSEATPRAGRIVRLGEAHVAVVEYAMHGTPLTYFALPSDQIMGRDVRMDEPMPASVNGYEVAVWKEGTQARALVAAMPRDEVLAVAKECRDKARMRVG